MASVDSTSMPDLSKDTSILSLKDRVIRNFNNSLNQFMQTDTPIPEDDAPVVMRGWLRKQGGVVKNWHNRWFVLRGNCLYYYTSNSETRLLGTIILSGNKVVEYPVSPAEPDKFPFEIIPGGDKSRMTMTHETYPFIASSEEDRLLWMTAIKRAMYSDVGGAIFGQSLEDTMAYENKTSNRIVPQILEQCVEFLEKHGLETEGIFRLPGRTILVKQLKDQFDCGSRPVFDIESVDIHSVASLLKLYLRELPGPLVPYDFYKEAMQIGTREINVNPDNAIESLSVLMMKLPRHNYIALQYLCHFLDEVSKKEPVNKMSVMNLATIFVQSIIRPKDNDPALLMGTAGGRTQVVFLLVTKWRQVFKVEYNRQGHQIQVDNLLNLGDEHNLKKEFKARTSISANRMTSGMTNVLFELDFSSDLMAPLTPTVTECHTPEPIEDIPVYDIPQPRVASIVREFDNSDEHIYDIPVPRKYDTTPPRISLISELSSKTDTSQSDDVVNSTPELQQSGVNPLESTVPQNDATESPTTPHQSPTTPQNDSTNSSPKSLPPRPPPITPVRPAKPILRRLSQPKVPPRPKHHRNAVSYFVPPDANVRTIADSISSDNMTDLSSILVEDSTLGIDDQEWVSISLLPDENKELNDKTSSTDNSMKPENNLTRKGSFDSDITGSIGNCSLNSSDASLNKNTKMDNELPDSNANINAKCNSPNVNIRPAPQPKSRRFASNTVTVSMMSENMIDSLDDARINDLTTKNLKDAPRDDLLSHITALTSELNIQRTEVRTLTDKLSTVKHKHLQIVQNLAKQLDQEKSATADAVDRIVKLQAQLQAYQLKFGTLDEAAYGKTLFYH